jgi:hypothetical protein
MPTGDTTSKQKAPYCSTSVVVWKRIKNTKIKEILDFYETIDLTKKHKEQKM